MTRKRAIEIVVANVKAGLPLKRWKGYEGWNEVFIGHSGTTTKASREVHFYVTDAPFQVPRHNVLGWWLSRPWLEEKGYL